MYEYMYILFFLVARFYQEAFRGNNKSPFYFLCLTYLCSVFTGIYSSIVALVTYLAAISTYNPTHYTIKEKCFISWNRLRLWFFLHVKLVLYLSWIIVPSLISYPYLGNETSKVHGGFVVPNIMQMFTHGNLFDYNQHFKYCTVLIFCGILLAIVRLCLHVYTSYSVTNYPLHSDLKFALWLLSMTSISVVLYVQNPIWQFVLHYLPLDIGFDTKSFIIGIQSCGAFFIGFSLDKFVEILSHIPRSNRKTKKVLLTVLIGLVLIKDGADRVSGNIPLLKMSDDFGKTLKEFRLKQNGNGRILTTTRLGK